MIKLLVFLLIHLLVVNSAPDCKFNNCRPCTVNAGDCVWCAGVNSTVDGTVVWGVCANYGNCPHNTTRSTCDPSLGCSSYRKEKECQRHSLCKWCEDSLNDSENYCSTNCSTQASCYTKKDLSSCIDSSNCGWCPSNQVCMNIYESTLCINATMIFDQKLSSNLTQLNKDCRLLTCGDCINDPLCTWCEGSYSTIKGNYTWGVCYSEVGSICTDNGGILSDTCVSKSITLAPVLPLPDSNSINTDNDDCLNYYNCNSCLKNQDCGWCTGSEDINLWGECRSVTKKKNGELGENFCLRYGGSWKSNSCEDSTKDIKQLVTNILTPIKVNTGFEVMASQRNINSNLQIFQVLATYQTNNTLKVVAIIEKNNTNIFITEDFSPFENQLCNTVQSILQRLLTVSGSRFACELEILTNNKGTSKIVVALNIQDTERTNQKKN